MKKSDLKIDGRMCFIDRDISTKNQLLIWDKLSKFMIQNNITMVEGFISPINFDFDKMIIKKNR